MSQISKNDYAQLAEKGIAKEKVLGQIEIFKEGIPFVNLEKAAVVGEGILKFSEAQEKALIENFEQVRGERSLLKFVPASGAASRMFKALFNFLETFDPNKETLTQYLERSNDSAMKTFTERLTDLPFYKNVQSRIKGDASSKDEEVYLFVKELLSENGLNYGFYPKGLLPFHNYGSFVATPFEEHLNEGALYSKTGDTANLHFTISEQHNEMFTNLFSEVKDRFEKETGTKFNLGFSYQKAATDTIAVDMENKPFRETDGSLLFRPGGHGALIENLNELDADIIFIKNIDNVVFKNNLDKVANSKKVLAGLLLKVQQKAFEYAEFLDTDTVSEGMMTEIKGFLERELNARFIDNYYSYTHDEQIGILKDKLNRPIRICGMVKNEGEPGGGPFWINDGNGHISLQIIESAQVDMNNAKQADLLLKQASHFNPVDLVCAIKNYKGEKFNLLDYVDYKQGFITEKTKDGKALKALELPGLWNGAMAFWNTIFVEVPLMTFNPVKTVNDLLKATHQPN
ncbi:MAG: DUF4301 family protein [Flavobacteriaceae bacterium]